MADKEVRAIAISHREERRVSKVKSRVDDQLKDSIRAEVLLRGELATGTRHGPPDDKHSTW